MEVEVSPRNGNNKAKKTVREVASSSDINYSTARRANETLQSLIDNLPARQHKQLEVEQKYDTPEATIGTENLTDEEVLDLVLDGGRAVQAKEPVRMGGPKRKRPEESTLGSVKSLILWVSEDIGDLESATQSPSSDQVSACRISSPTELAMEYRPEDVPVESSDTWVRVVDRADILALVRASLFFYPDVVDMSETGGISDIGDQSIITIHNGVFARVSVWSLQR